MDQQPLQRLRDEPRALRVRRTLPGRARRRADARPAARAHHSPVDQGARATAHAGALEPRRAARLSDRRRLGQELRHIRVARRPRSHRQRSRRDHAYFFVIVDVWICCERSDRRLASRHAQGRPDSERQRQVVRAHLARRGLRHAPLVHARRHCAQVQPDGLQRDAPQPGPLAPPTQLGLAGARCCGRSRRRHRRCCWTGLAALRAPHAASAVAGRVRLRSQPQRTTTTTTLLVHLHRVGEHVAAARSLRARRRRWRQSLHVVHIFHVYTQPPAAAAAAQGQVDRSLAANINTAARLIQRRCSSSQSRRHLLLVYIHECGLVQERRQPSAQDVQSDREGVERRPSSQLGQGQRVHRRRRECVVRLLLGQLDDSVRVDGGARPAAARCRPVAAHGARATRHALTVAVAQRLPPPPPPADGRSPIQPHNQQQHKHE